MVVDLNIEGSTWVQGRYKGSREENDGVSSRLRRFSKIKGYLRGSKKGIPKP